MAGNFSKSVCNECRACNVGVEGLWEGLGHRLQYNPGPTTPGGVSCCYSVSISCPAFPTNLTASSHIPLTYLLTHRNFCIEQVWHPKEVSSCTILNGSLSQWLMSKISPISDLQRLAAQKSYWATFLRSWREHTHMAVKQSGKVVKESCQKCFASYHLCYLSWDTQATPPMSDKVRDWL